MVTIAGLILSLTALVPPDGNAQATDEARATAEYDSLIARAKAATTITLGSVTVAKDATDDPLRLLEEAARAQPRRPEAYEALAFLQLYLTDGKGKPRVSDWALVERTMRAAMDNGGEARFQVAHLHNAWVTACAGLLKVRKDGLAYTISKVYTDTKDDNFDVARSEVREVKSSSSFSAKGSGHLSVTIGEKTYNFCGLNRQAKYRKLRKEERDLIIRLATS